MTWFLAIESLMQMGGVSVLTTVTGVRFLTVYLCCMSYFLSYFLSYSTTKKDKNFKK